MKKMMQILALPRSEGTLADDKKASYKETRACGGNHAVPDVLDGALIRLDRDCTASSVVFF